MAKQPEIRISQMSRADAVSAGLFTSKTGTTRGARWGVVHQQIRTTISAAEESGNDPEVLVIELPGADKLKARRVVQAIRNLLEDYDCWKPHIRMVVDNDGGHIYTMLERIDEHK